MIPSKGFGTSTTVYLPVIYTGPDARACVGRSCAAHTSRAQLQSAGSTPVQKKVRLPHDSYVSAG